MRSLTHLPGGELVASGLRDCECGRITPESCLVELARPRLQRSGLMVNPGITAHIPDPHHQLYQLLLREEGDAYSRYNAYIRQLVSFEHSLEHEISTHGLTSSTHE